MPERRGIVLVNAVSEKDLGEDKRKREKEKECEKLRKLLVEGLEGFVIDEKCSRPCSVSQGTGLFRNMSKGQLM